MGTVATENKQAWVDNLRVIATISVVVLHVTTPILFKYGAVLNDEWWFGNVVDSFVRYCVPLFVMLTGALVLPREYDLIVFLKKRLFRIVLPFVFWSFIYLSLQFAILFLNGDRLTPSVAIDLVSDNISQGSSYHLWYVYMIIGIYLFIPVIGKWIRNASEREIRYFLLIWTITLFLNLPFFSFFKTNIELSYFSGFIGYLVLGYYLAEKGNNFKLSNLMLILLVLSGTLVTLFGTYFLTELKGAFDKTFYHYLTPNVAVSTIGVFLLIKKSRFSNSGLLKIRDFISRYSFGIYLVHVLVLLIIGKFGINGQLIHPLLGIPVTTFVCLTISGCIIYCINKFIPYGTFISG